MLATEELRIEVEHKLREISATIIVSSFNKLTAADIREKAPSAIVTRIDEEMEAKLTPILADLVPGSVVVGEESVSANPSLLHDLERGWVWLLDPLDGTNNFVAGRENFAVMLALMQDGVPVASWLLNPMKNIARSAVRRPVQDSTLGEAPGDRQVSGRDLRGAAWTQYYAADLRAKIESRFSTLGNVTSGLRCAGAEYLSLLEKRQDFILFWNSMPWDHTPGIFLVREAGGKAAYVDGTPFKPGRKQYGLLIARDPATWHVVWDALIAGLEGSTWFQPPGEP